MRVLAMLAVVMGLAFVGVQSALADGPPPASTAPPIAITGFSPTSGIVGTQVTITGTGLDVIDNVGFGGGEWTQFTHVSPTQVTATVPNTVTGKIVVSTHNYTPAITAFSAADFVITSPPRIDLVVPSSAPAGAVVRIRGAFLDTATSVTYNGAAVGFVAGLDPGQPSYSIVTTQVPAGTSNGAFTVVTPGGSATSGTFTVVSPPSISGISPGSGRVGATVTLSGANLAGVTAATLNGQTVGFSVNGAAQVTVTIPSWGTTGTFALTSPGGTATSDTFTVLPDAPAAPPATASSQPAAAGPLAVAPGGAPAVATPGAARVSATSSSANSRKAVAGSAAGLSGATPPALTAAERVTRNARGAIVRIDLALVGPRGMAGHEVLVQAAAVTSAGKPSRWVTLGVITLGSGAHSTLSVMSRAGLALAHAGAHVRLVDPSSLVVVSGGTLTLRA